VLIFIGLSYLFGYNAYSLINQCNQSYNNYDTRISRTSISNIYMPGIIMCFNFDLSNPTCTYSNNGAFSNPVQCSLNYPKLSFYETLNCIDSNFEINRLLAMSTRSNIEVLAAASNATFLPELLILELIIYNQTSWPESDHNQILQSDVVYTTEFTFSPATILSLQALIQVSFNVYPNNSIYPQWEVEVIPQTLSSFSKTGAQIGVQYKSLNFDVVEFYVSFDWHQLVAQLGGLYALVKTAFNIISKISYPTIRFCCGCSICCSCCCCCCKWMINDESIVLPNQNSQ